jgi:hypothetical protein
LAQISIVGEDGKPVLYASLTSEGKLFFEFELYARNENEGDYEFNHTVQPEEFPKIAAMFGLNPKDPIMNVVQQITDIGKGKELERALTKQDIKNEPITKRTLYTLQLLSSWANSMISLKRLDIPVHH